MLLDAIDSGKSRNEVAQFFNISRRRVGYIIAEYRGCKRFKTMTDRQRVAVAKWWDRGEPIEKIMKRFKFDRRTVMRNARLMGCRPKPRGRPRNVRT